tara:strand:+ start:731 stop:2098 length:1368 start_codon:yes stop_codon:yes gene_type:complete
MQNSSSDRVKFLLEAPIIGMLLKLAIPNSIAVITMTSIMLADARFVAQLGTTGLASLAVVFPFQSLLQMMAAGAIGGGVTSSVARALGAGDREKAQEAAWHSLIIIGVMAAIYTIVLGFFCRPLFSLLGATDEVLDGSVTYSRVLFGAAFIGWLFFVGMSWLRAIGQISFLSTIVIISSISQIVMSGAFTLGWGPFPSMGISGPAIATVLSQTVAGSYIIYVMTGRKMEIRLRPYKFNIHAINDIMKVGGIGLINSTSIASTLVIVTWVIGRYGDAALAGYGLGSRLEIILTPIAFGVGGILTTVVGANFGARQFIRARNVAWLGCAVTFVITTIIGVMSAIEPGLWLDRFTSDPEVYKYGALYLAIAGPFYGFFGGGQTLYFANQGTGKMVVPVLISFARLLLVCAVGIMCVLFEWNLSVIFWAVGIGLLIIGTGLSLNMFGPVWKPKEILNPN